MTQDDPESVSIVICTHNRAATLERALASLASLELPSKVDVEVVVVENACTDGTCAAVARGAVSIRFPVRRIIEPTPNLGLARNRGVEQSHGNIIAMLDDDTVVPPEWLKGLLEAYRAHPADIVGGKVDLVWGDTQRPTWLTDRHAKAFSYCDNGPNSIEIHKAGDMLGANYSFRRRVFDTLGGFTPGLGRTGAKLLGGEEIDFTWRALQKGFRVFYAPRAVVGHCVPPDRVTMTYLCSHAQGNARTRIYARRDLTAIGAVARLLSGCAVYVLNAPLALWHRLTGSQTKYVDALIRKHRGLGKAIGAFEFLTGRMPTEVIGGSRRAAG